MKTIRINLKDGNADNPIVDQLADHGVNVKGSSKTLRELRHNIWAEFSIRANEFYYLSSVESVPRGEDNVVCDLCGHPIRDLYRIMIREGKERLITRHYDLGEDGVEIVWPTTFVVGNECIKQLGVTSQVMRFFRSYINRNVKLKLRESDQFIDRIQIGDLLLQNSNWRYGRVRIPLYAFTRLPAVVEEKFDITPNVMFCRPMLTLKRNTAKTVMKRRIMPAGAAELYMDDVDSEYSLCYSMSREEASKIWEYAMAHRDECKR